MIGRIAVLDVSPAVPGGAGPWAVRATPGEVLPVAATVFREGHDAVGATAVLRGPNKELVTARLHCPVPGTDRFVGELVVPAEGVFTLTVEGWSDPYGTWAHGVRAKRAADVELTVEFEEGARLLEQLARAVPRSSRAAVLDAAATLRAADANADSRLAPALGPLLSTLAEQFPVRELVTASAKQLVRVDRQRALFGSWYEFFPRSEGGWVGATARLDAIAAMHFDVVYLPPVHPIGRSFRKGPNNTLTPGPDDPGSPWAIGAAEGGHDALAPELGSEEQFRGFLARAADLGLEVALDLALQCAPDHPWVSAHPEWFTTRPDGSIAYAENPPKKYQDIYPLNFDNDPQGLRAEILRVVRHWMDYGVRIFRVDNPHTKPLPFWEWLIAEVLRTDPDVIFLAEAFTRPAMMHTLAKIGFHQSYSYFTWRTAAWELEEYFTELTTAPAVDYMRPNLFVNTPDILHAYLQHGGRPAFVIRAVLAATLAPTWGVYSGYELYENVAVRPGSEEYLDSEKYQVRHRDWAAADREGRSLAPLLTDLNRIRREHPALQRLRGLRFHPADNPDLIAYSRTVRTGDRLDTVLCVVNVNPYEAREGLVHVDPSQLTGDPAATSCEVSDQLGSRGVYRWGPANFVRLDPASPAHLFVVTP